MNKTLIIEGKLPTLNEYINAERGNKYAAAKLKKQATDTVAWQAKAQLKPYSGKQVYSFFWYQKNKRKDPDNIAFAKKFIFDGLIKAEIIENDGWDQVGMMIDHFIIGDSEHVSLCIQPDE